MIFIIGLGRSGTSLMQSILNAHSEIAFLPETHFLRKYVFPGKLENKSDAEIKTILKNDEHYHRAGIDEHILLSYSGIRDAKTLFDTLTKLYLDKKNKLIVGEKDPRNLDFVKNIVHLYPDAKFIHIKRDPRDIVASRLKAQWSASLPFIFHPLIINAQFNNALKFLSKYKPANYYEIIYENLLSDSENELKSLCRFIGVKYENEMLNYSNSSKELVADSEMQWKKETFKPIMKNNYNKWKKNLSNNQAYIAQTICKDIFKNSDYQVEEISVSFWVKLCKPFLVLLSGFISMLYPIRIILNK